jgi:hypothetical protein
MHRDCLDPAQIKSIAAGRSTEKELAAVRGHLAECARCRGAVATRAGGFRGAGDTTVLEHREAPLPMGIRVGAVVFSLLAATVAWHYSGALQRVEPAPSTKAPLTASRHEPASPQPKELEKTPTPDSRESAVAPVSPPSPPVADRAVVADGAVSVVRDPRLKREDPVPTRRPSRTETRAVRSVPSVEPARNEDEDEVDFGIDEPAPGPPVVKGRVIRTVLE